MNIIQNFYNKVLKNPGFSKAALILGFLEVFRQKCYLLLTIEIVGFFTLNSLAYLLFDFYKNSQIYFFISFGLLYLFNVVYLKAYVAYFRQQSQHKLLTKMMQYQGFAHKVLKGIVSFLFDKQMAHSYFSAIIFGAFYLFALIFSGIFITRVILSV